MANYLDTLLGRIDDPNLATALTREVERLRDQRQFGLVFERHLPERVRLYSHPIRRGVTVQVKTETDGPVWMVQKVTKGQASIARLDGDDQLEEKHPVNDLVVVREFGQPIYPGLKSVGKVERGGDKPFHTVINAENFHALETLLYAYENQVDCIYIDPPYNTGARDWKYNNDYVDGADQYRHSKWLSFMEKRLRLARRLLNPQDSVLIVTIDEKEFLRLGLLLEQIFTDAAVQMVTSVIAPAGQPRGSQMSRVEEYLFCVYLGQAAAVPQADDMLSRQSEAAAESESVAPVSWENLIRRGTSARRQDRENQFFPIFIEPESGRIVAVGQPLLPVTVDRNTVTPPEGTVAVWPIRTDGSEGRWRVGHAAVRALAEKGFVRVGRQNRDSGQWAMNYVLRSDIARIESGEIRVDGYTSAGAAILSRDGETAGTTSAMPKTVWYRDSHNAGNYGTAMLRSVLPGRAFPFPKSLYAVEDALRFFVADKPQALVVDFFGGSGTTTHAVMRLNRQDDGRRRSIVITNNEVGPDVEKDLREAGYSPGDTTWEAQGIAHLITWPRVRAALTGLTPAGDAVRGNYKFRDEFPISEGFQENAEFLELTYQDRDHVSLGHAFAAIAPLLWLKAGAQGRRIDRLPEGEPWALPADGTYGILFEPNAWRKFVKAVDKHGAVRHVFVVTDAVTAFQQVLSELPAGVEATMLYEDYLSTFEINTGLGAE